MSAKSNGGDDPLPHGHVSHGTGRFLLWVGQRRDEIDGFDPDISELAELYERWSDDTEQAELTRWCE